MRETRFEFNRGSEIHIWPTAIEHAENLGPITLSIHSAAGFWFQSCMTVAQALELAEGLRALAQDPELVVPVV